MLTFTRGYQQHKNYGKRWCCAVTHDIEVQFPGAVLAGSRERRTCTYKLCDDVINPRQGPIDLQLMEGEIH